MVSTRQQNAGQPTDKNRTRNITLAGIALLVLIATLIGGVMTTIGAAHQVGDLLSRTFGHQPTVGEHAAASWDTIKDWASSSGQVLPEPTLYQRAQSLVTRKPLIQVQTEDLWQRTQEVATSQGRAARDAAGSKAGEYLDEAKRQALPAPTLFQRAQSWATGKPVQQIQAEALYGSLKDQAGSYAAAGQEKAGEYASKAYHGARDAAGNVADEAQAQYRDYTEETIWDKLKRLATGRSRAQVHYDAAKDRAGDATGHMTEAAREAYEATKAAGGAAASGAASAWHSDAADKAGKKVRDTTKPYVDAAGQKIDEAKGAAANAAGSAADNAKWAADNTAQAAKDAYNDGAEGAKQRVGDAAQGVKDAAGHASTQAGLTAEKARHRAEEYAQELKHAAQEKLHAAKAEL